MKMWKRLTNMRSRLFGRHAIEDVWDGEGWVPYDEWLERQNSTP